MKTNYSWFVLLALLASCSRSQIYSPSINLPVKPLSENQIDITSGVELMPEIRPEQIDNKFSSLGLNMQLQYGFTDRLTLGVKAWYSLQLLDENLRSGYALTGVWTIPVDPMSQFLVLPRVGMVLDNYTIEGYGLGASCVYQLQHSDKFSYYGGLGGLWGRGNQRFSGSSNASTNTTETGPEVGVAIIGNIGFAWEFLGPLRLNAEMNPAYHFNFYDQQQQFIVAPSLSLGYSLSH